MDAPTVTLKRPGHVDVFEMSAGMHIEVDVKTGEWTMTRDTHTAVGRAMRAPCQCRIGQDHPLDWDDV